MRFLKQFKLFESIDEEEIHQICKKYRIANYIINSDGSIDVDGSIFLTSKKLEKLPLIFGKVTGNFRCDNNHLTSLEGCPKTVGGNFSCSRNQLQSLEGCPRSVAMDFFCYHNQLQSLEGCPQLVGGDFDCTTNQLESLEGGPQSVSGNFNCSYNQLTSLEGGPQSVGGNFISGYNQLTSFEGFPELLGGSFHCIRNPLNNIWNLFKDKSLIEYFNEFDCIRGNDIIIDRLNAFLDEVGKPNVESVEGYKNI